MITSRALGLTLAVCYCCILVTQGRRISQRHDVVVGPHDGPALDTSGWRPVVDSGRPQLEQVAVSPTGYDGDSELVPPPRRSPGHKPKKNRPQLVASETRISTGFTALPPEPTAKRPIRFPDEKRRPIRRHRPPTGVHLRPYLAQESAQQHVRFRPSPPAPDNLWAEPTEPSVGHFTPQFHHDGHLQLAIAPHEQSQPQVQVFGNPAFFNLESPLVRRPQDNAFLEPSVHENEVLQHQIPKYQITEPSPPPPRRRRPTRPPQTEEHSYIDPEMHRSPQGHEAPAWSTEASVRPRRPKPTPHQQEQWHPQEEQPEEEQQQERRPRPPAPVQEEHEDDTQKPVFKLRPRKPIASPPTDEQHQEERVTLRPRRPRPPPQPVVQEDLEQEVSSPRPPQEEERPLKRRRPRPPSEAGAPRRRRPRPRPQVQQEPEVVEEEQQPQQQQQEPEEERTVHRQPIQNWPMKPTTPAEEEATQENYPEAQQENYPPQHEENYPPQQQHVFPQLHFQQQHHEQQQAHEENYPEHEHQVEEVPYQQSSEEVTYEHHEPVSEEVNHQEPNEVTSTETQFSIPPKRKRPEPEQVVVPSTTPTTSTTTTTLPTTTPSIISTRLRAKLNMTRPRFSLNNIKDRIRQQQLQNPEQKDEPESTEAPSNRFRVGTSTTTEAPTTERSTFRPSMGRFTRPPFNSRYRSTTAAPGVATTTEQLVTRRANPDLFNQNRRPNLRRRTTEPPMTTTEAMEEQEEDKEMESTTEEEVVEMTTMLPVSSTTPEDFSYAKRVTDLTSSATAFNPLSFFSAVPANGKHASQLRFTMATEDPVLPIEAFFPAFTSRPNKPHGE